MDISGSLAPRSDQQNFDDYAAGPKTLTIAEVKQGSAEQPVEIHVVEFPGRPYKPSKSMRRVLVAAWGAEASAYAGRRIRLKGDPTVKFGRDVVGGIKIDALSHISEPVTVNLTVTRGKREPHVVQPLPDAPTATPDASKVPAAVTAINTAATLDALNSIETHARTLGISGHPDVVVALDARKKELT